jgi:hypothetical protein
MAAAADGAFAAVFAAVVIVGRDASEGGTLAAIEGSELGHFGQEDEGGDEADALGGSEESELGFPEGMSVDLGAELAIEGGEAFFEGGDGFVDLGDQSGKEHLLTMGAQELDHLDELMAVGDALGEGEVFPAERWTGRWALGVGKALDEFGIDGIVFGDDAFGEAVVVDAEGIADGEDQARVLEGQAEGEVIATGRLTEDVDGPGDLFEAGDELAMAGFGVGEVPALTLEGDDEGVLGDIDSEVA